MAAKTIASYISDWMNDNARNAWDLDANVALVWFNRRYHEIENKIATFIMDNYFDAYYSIDLDSTNNVYTLPEWNSSWQWLTEPELRKLLEISIDYTGNWHYVKADELPDWDLPHPLEWYAKHATRWHPMFKFDWKSNIIIFPFATEDITDWIHIRYAANTPDIQNSSTATEEDLTIPRQYIHVILMWMSWDNAKAVKDPDVMMYKQDYYQAMNEMLAELSDRYIQPTQYHTPNLRWLMN